MWWVLIYLGSCLFKEFLCSIIRVWIFLEVWQMYRFICKVSLDIIKLYSVLLLPLFCEVHCKTRVNIILLESKYYPCKRSNLFWGRNYFRNKGNLYARGRIQKSNLKRGKFYPVWDKFYSCYIGREFRGDFTPRCAGSIEISRTVIRHFLLKMVVASTACSFLASNKVSQTTLIIVFGVYFPAIFADQAHGR